MAQVVYLLSSLPYLDIDSLDTTGDVGVNDTFTIDEFLEACEVLGPTTAKQIAIAIHNPCESTLAIAKIWSNYEYSIRNEFAKSRWAALRTGTYKPMLVHDSVPVTAEGLEMLAFINKESNPLIREKTVLMTKWRILTSLNAKYQFTLENIIVYGWKLQLFRRYLNLTEKRGNQQWNTLVANISETAGFSISSITGGV